MFCEVCVANQWDKFADRFEEAQKIAREKHEQQKINEDFISTHGYDSWNELGRTVQEICDHINSRRKGSESFTFRRENELRFVVTSNVVRGQVRLDATFSQLTKVIDWRLDGVEGVATRGKLTPTRVDDKFMYSGEGLMPSSVPETAQFLVKMTF